MAAARRQERYTLLVLAPRRKPPHRRDRRIWPLLRSE